MLILVYQLLNISSSCYAEISTKTPLLADRLNIIRSRVNKIEDDLISGKQSQKSIQAQLKKLQSLLGLHKLEQTLSRERMNELEHTINELEIRKIKLKDKVS